MPGGTKLRKYVCSGLVGAFRRRALTRFAFGGLNKNRDTTMLANKLTLAVNGSSISHSSDGSSSAANPNWPTAICNAAASVNAASTTNGNTWWYQCESNRENK